MATIFSNVESTQRMAFRRHNFDLPADSRRSMLFNSTAYESAVDNRAPNPFRDNSAQLGTSGAGTPAIHQQLQRGERDFLKLFNTESEESAAASSDHQAGDAVERKNYVEVEKITVLEKRRTKMKRNNKMKSSSK
ncbi:unnamed protein product, partial [Amoebophrya sp. A120]|eukprot:GSA120T00023716001.1